MAWIEDLRSENAWEYSSATSGSYLHRHKNKYNLFDCEVKRDYHGSPYKQVN